MKNLVYGFSGVSNSGKTTLILNLIRTLQEEAKKNHANSPKIAVLKHDPKAKAVFDVAGKDSDLFYKQGADVILHSPRSTTIRFQESLDLSGILHKIGEVDYLFVEGLKILSIPKLAVMRESIEEDYLSFVNAIALGNTASQSLQSYQAQATQDSLQMLQKIALYPLEDYASILRHIETHAITLQTLLQKLKEQND